MWESALKITSEASTLLTLMGENGCPLVQQVSIHKDICKRSLNLVGLGQDLTQPVHRSRNFLNHYPKIFLCKLMAKSKKPIKSQICQKPKSPTSLVSFHYPCVNIS